MEPAEPSKTRGIAQILMLSFFLIGLPFGGYVYLNKGYQYQKTLMSNLTKERTMPALTNSTLLYGNEPDSLIGSMHIVSFVNHQKSINSFGETFEKLHEQFDAPSNIDFVILTENADSAWAASFLEAKSIDDLDQIRIYSTSQQNFQQLAEDFGITSTQFDLLKTSPLIAMVDDSMYVRIVYESAAEDQVKKLVEQIAVMLPERNKPRARVKRETEK